MFQGSITALITPFRDGRVDEDAFVALCERQIVGGTAALVPCGTTGEAATLSMDEHKRVIDLTVQTARGRVPVLAGCGSNATSEAIELMAHAKAAGVEGALVVAPYYNRPNPEGLVAHFDALTKAVALPIVVYNVPSRTSIDIEPKTMARLAALPQVIGCKDSAGDPSRTFEHFDLCGPDFIVLCGDDYLALAFGAYGAQGCVSVVGNIVPQACAALQAAILAGDYHTARQIDATLQPLGDAVFLDPSPGPTKYALAKLGLCAPDLRLPLTPPGPAACAAVDAGLARAGVQL